MNTTKLLQNTLLGLILISGLSACTQSNKPTIDSLSYEESCTIPTHKKLQVAISKAQSELANRSCHYQFDAMHKQLLRIAQDDQDKNNKNKFFEFYQWSVDQGIISKRQGKEYYNRYFQPTFGNVLSNDRNVCSLKSDTTRLMKQLDSELIDKKTGLLTIMQDNKSFFEAQRIHNELIFLIETTLMACEA